MITEFRRLPVVRGRPRCVRNSSSHCWRESRRLVDAAEVENVYHGLTAAQWVFPFLADRIRQPRASACTLLATSGASTDILARPKNSTRFALISTITKASKTPKKARRDLALGLAVALCLLAALIVTIGQVIAWLHTGKWTGLSLATVILAVVPDSDLASWVRGPQTWIGLQRVISEIPVAFLLITLGAGLASRL
jgi:hypothetical protein